MARSGSPARSSARVARSHSSLWRRLSVRWLAPSRCCRPPKVPPASISGSWHGSPTRTTFVPARLGVGEEAGELAGADHGGFVDDEHGGVVECRHVPVDAGQEAVDRRRRGCRRHPGAAWRPGRRGSSRSPGGPTRPSASRAAASAKVLPRRPRLRRSRHRRPTSRSLAPSAPAPRPRWAAPRWRRRSRRSSATPVARCSPVQGATASSRVSVSSISGVVQRYSSVRAPMTAPSWRWMTAPGRRLARRGRARSGGTRRPGRGPGRPGRRPGARCRSP